MQTDEGDGGRDVRRGEQCAGGTSEIAVSDTAVHTNRSAGRALQRSSATAMTTPTTEKKPVTTANPDSGIVSPPSGTVEVDADRPGQGGAVRVVATIAASVAARPVTASRGATGASAGAHAPHRRQTRRQGEPREPVGVEDRRSR